MLKKTVYQLELGNSRSKTRYYAISLNSSKEYKGETIPKDYHLGLKR